MTQSDQIGTLSTSLSGKASRITKPISKNASETFNVSVPCFVSVGRDSISTTTTTAFIDQWRGITYINNNANYSLSINSSNVLTITNNGAYSCSAIVFF